jgi:serine acetyltransferase
MTLKADLIRNEDQAGRWAVTLFRYGQRAPRSTQPIFTLLIRILCGADIPLSVTAGPGLRLPHGSRGTVIHPKVVIGSEATIYHGVTMGVAGRGRLAAPVLGDGVYLGAGCVILGGVTIGDGATVGANAVVTKDIPAGRIAVGIPATLRPLDS